MRKFLSVMFLMLVIGFSATGCGNSGSHLGATGKHRGRKGQSKNSFHVRSFLLHVKLGKSALAGFAVAVGKVFSRFVHSVHYHIKAYHS